MIKYNIEDRVLEFYIFDDKVAKYHLAIDGFKFRTLYGFEYVDHFPKTFKNEIEIKKFCIKWNLS